jgi:hypothetical protein
MAPLLLGVDFTCAPSRRKPVTVAFGRCGGAPAGRLELLELAALPSLADFEALLRRPGPWFGAFDFPFGLPREFVEAQGLGMSCDAVITELRRRCPTRMAWRALVDAWGNARPAGRRLVHRATDLAGAIASTSPLQTRYVPVGFMYYEGLSRLVAAGVSLPGLRRGDPARVAVEGYPGRLAFELIGRRSYKNSAAADRAAARRDMLGALASARAGGARAGLAVAMSRTQRRALLEDDGGDRIDALLCLVQAARAAQQPDHGVPRGVDAVEGWIVGA